MCCADDSSISASDGLSFAARHPTMAHAQPLRRWCDALRLHQCANRYVLELNVVSKSAGRCCHTSAAMKTADAGAVTEQTLESAEPALVVPKRWSASTCCFGAAGRCCRTSAATTSRRCQDFGGASPGPSWASRPSMPTGWVPGAVWTAGQCNCTRITGPTRHRKNCWINTQNFAEVPTHKSCPDPHASQPLVVTAASTISCEPRYFRLPMITRWRTTAGCEQVDKRYMLDRFEKLQGSPLQRHLRRHTTLP